MRHVGCVFHLLLAATLHAQSVTIIHTMAQQEGSGIFSQLAAAPDGSLYGVAPADGTSGFGTVFKVTALGQLTILHTFLGTDGAEPYGRLLLASDGSLYGTTNSGGARNLGIIFQLVPPAGKSSQWTLTTLHTFSGLDGSNPYAGLNMDGAGTLYGTTTGGGTHGNGTVFSLTSGGTFRTLHSFHFVQAAQYCWEPYGEVLPANGVLVGATRNGGPTLFGALYEVSLDGSSFAMEGTATNQTSWMYAGLEQESDGNFYGVGLTGGANNTGALYRVTPAGDISVMYSLPASGYFGPYGNATLANDGRRYFTAHNDDAQNDGRIVAVDSAGNASIVYTFSGTDGATPAAQLTLAPDGDLYGSTMAGGANGYGVIFKIVP